MVGPLGFWNKLQSYQLQTAVRLGLRPNSALLDLGCGPLQGGIGFIRYLDAGGYTGVDHNPEAIQIGQEEFSRLKLLEKKPRLLISRSFGDEELGSSCFDFIWMSQVLYYFDEPTMHRLFEMVRRRLQPGGIMAGDILGPASDRSFLRPPHPPVHTAESLNTVAREHGLMVVAQGNLADWGYPKRLGLRNNILLQVNHLNEWKSDTSPKGGEVLL
jgi:SAM-dependent methyltransferase